MKKLRLERSIVVALVAAGLAAGCNRTLLPTAASTISATTPSTVIDTANPMLSASAGAGGATGDGVNDAGACDADAHTSCSGFYSPDWQAFARANGYTTASWKYGLLSCLRANDVSAACTSSLDRREALNAQMMTACARYCRGTSPTPGAEPCVDRLKSIYDTLDNACRTALDAHEAAKALDGRGPF